MTAPANERPIALIADDDETMRLMLSEAAEHAGMAVIAVADGQSALQAALHTPLALALLDVEMPGLDGYEVCRRLRAQPHARSLPILIITGRDDPESVAAAYEAGATDFMSKPLNWPLIPHRLRYARRNGDLVRALEERESENAALIGSMPEMIMIVCRDGRLRRAWNHAAADAAGGAPDRLEALLPAAVAARAARSARETALDGRPRTDAYATQDEGDAERSFELRCYRCANGEVLVVRQDVTERRQAERRIFELAYTDVLTGLPNRQGFLEALSARLAEAGDSGSRHAVVCLRLESFDRIVRAFGHPLSDDVLREAAAKFEAVVARCAASGVETSLARYEAGEFWIALHGARAHEMAVKVARDVAARFAAAVRCRRQDFFVRPMLGVALHPDHGADASTLVRNASVAMFHPAPGALGEPAVYTDSIGARALEWLSLDAELRRALGDGSLELHYQPKFRLHDRRIVGAEALLRWTHPRLGPIAPGRFIPIAEETGLILELGAWVVRAAVSQLRAWRAAGLAMPLAVNVSGKEFLHGDPAALVERELASGDLQPGSLEIEVTESVLLGDHEPIARSLARLKRLGCRIALDDFGTGYSSLAYLQRLPLDSLKVDRSFVANVHRSPGDAAIFEAIANLAARFGLAVVAEGVEEEAQLRWLERSGCDEAQGFLLGHPMRAAELELLAGSLLPGVEPAGAGRAAAQRPAQAASAPASGS
ncbi:MAG: EAL domain-containing protein [Steroidobacteraceae bacterium]|nr:EAL domain-containing protein [Steroidobacteraceae bacterium]